MAHFRRQSTYLCLGILTVATLGCPMAKQDDRATQQSSKSDTSVVAKEAKASIDAGKIILKEYPPLPAPGWHSTYVQLLRERFQVEYVVPKRPEGTKESDFIAQVRAWNAVMEAEIARKHGAEAMAKAHADAEAQWRGKLKSQK